MADFLAIMPRIGYMDSQRSNPSLPLSILSAVRIASQEFAVKIIDLRISSNWEKEIKMELEKKPILAGTTCWTGPMIKDVVRVLKIVKENSDVPTVIGGIHPSLLPEQTISHPNIDFLIKGEGEIALYKLLKILKEGGDFQNVEGLWYKEDGKIKNCPENSPLDLNKLPDLPYDLVNVNTYLPLYAGRKSINFESSRGCPFSCRFCYQKEFSKNKIRFLSAELIIKRILNLKEKYKCVEDIYFIDDNFFLDLERARNIAEGFINTNLTYQVQGVDILTLLRMDDAYLRLLEKSGLRRITIGIETGSERLRKYLGKRGSVKDVIEVIKKLKEYKFIIYCSFFGGYPEEKMEDVRESIGLILNLMEINPNFRCSPHYLYVPFPGTEMYEELCKNDFFHPPQEFEKWGDYSWEENPYMHTLSKKKNIFYKKLYLCTLFADGKFREYEVPRFNKFFFSIYTWIAKVRLKKFYFGFMPEMILYKKLCKF